MGAWRGIGRLLRRLMYPRAGFLSLLVLLSAAGLLVVFTQEREQTPLAYGVYTLSAYTTAAASWRAVLLWKKGRSLLHRNVFFHRYMTDLRFKAKISLYLSLGVTLGYSIYKSFIAIRFRSAWFGSVACYYIVLGIGRFLLVRHIRAGQDDPIQEQKIYGFCGYLLLVLTASLGAMSFYTIYEGRSAAYPGHMIYAAAGFAFYSLGMAWANLVRYRALNSPIYSASKIFTLATALVSMFSLQASMFTAFGDGSQWQVGMNAGTGCCVFLLIAGMALIMIRRSRRATADPSKQK